MKARNLVFFFLFSGVSFGFLLGQGTLNDTWEKAVREARKGKWASSVKLAAGLEPKSLVGFLKGLPKAKEKPEGLLPFIDIVGVSPEGEKIIGKTISSRRSSYHLFNLPALGSPAVGVREDDMRAYCLVLKDSDAMRWWANPGTVALALGWKIYRKRVWGEGWVDLLDFIVNDEAFRDDVRAQALIYLFEADETRGEAAVKTLAEKTDHRPNYLLRSALGASKAASRVYIQDFSKKACGKHEFQREELFCLWIALNVASPSGINEDVWGRIGRYLAKFMAAHGQGDPSWGLCADIYSELVSDKLVQVPRDPKERSAACKGILALIAQNFVEGYGKRGLEIFTGNFWFLQENNLGGVGNKIVLDSAILHPGGYEDGVEGKYVEWLGKAGEEIVNSSMVYVLEDRACPLEKKVKFLGGVLSILEEKVSLRTVGIFKDFLGWERKFDSRWRECFLKTIVENKKIPEWIRRELSRN